jgi:hypothetical protein
MSSLKTERIIQLAKEKTAEKEKFALEAIDELKQSGEKITFYSVAKQTGLSKTFLYNNESVRQVIEDARLGGTETSDGTQATGSLDTKQILATIQQIKTENPDSYEAIRSALLDSSSETRK